MRNFKFFGIVAILLVIVVSLTGCMNPRAEYAASWWPWTWGDRTLAESLEAGCAGGAVSTVIDDSTYPCPDAESQSPQYPPAPGEVVTDTVVLTDTVWYNPCTQGAAPEMQIEPLVENGQEVPNAFMGLDLNRTEVTRGERYKILAVEGSYMHLFVAINDADSSGNGLTYEVVGKGEGIHTMSTAWTLWCNAGTYANHDQGQARVMNAKQLPEPLQDIWMNIPESGIMPIPPAAAAPEQSQATAEANPQTVVCSAPQGWSKVSDAEFHIGPLAADAPLKDFQVPAGMTLHYSYESVGKSPAQAGQNVDLHEGSLFCNQ